jgi:hypothetical protein
MGRTVVINVTFVFVEGRETGVGVSLILEGTDLREKASEREEPTETTATSDEDKKENGTHVAGVVDVGPGT